MVSSPSTSVSIAALPCLTAAATRFVSCFHALSLLCSGPFSSTPTPIYDLLRSGSTRSIVKSAPDLSLPGLALPFVPSENIGSWCTVQSDSPSCNEHCSTNTQAFLCMPCVGQGGIVPLLRCCQAVQRLIDLTQAAHCLPALSPRLGTTYLDGSCNASTLTGTRMFASIVMRLAPILDDNSEFEEPRVCALCRLLRASSSRPSSAWRSPP